MFVREMVGLIVDVVFVVSAVGAIGCLVVGWRGDWRMYAKREIRQMVIVSVIVSFFAGVCAVLGVTDLNFRWRLSVGDSYTVDQVQPVNEKHDIVFLVGKNGQRDRMFIFCHGMVAPGDTVDREVYYANKL